MLYDFLAKGSGYHWSVMQEDYMVDNHQGMTMLVVRQQVIGPQAFVLWCSSCDERSEFEI